MTHHRSALRAQTDAPVTVHADGHTFECRAVDLSTQGVVLEQAAALEHHSARPFYWLELPFGDEGILALARVAWRRGTAVAFRFIDLSDCDRLTLAEQMDMSTKLWGCALHLRQGVGQSGRVHPGQAEAGRAEPAEPVSAFAVLDSEEPE